MHKNKNLYNKSESLILSFKMGTLAEKSMYYPCIAVFAVIRRTRKEQSDS